MKFYNRENELSMLSGIAALSRRTAHMVVITGRRRIGKTELIRQFSKGRSDVLYLFVSKKNRIYCLRNSGISLQKGYLS